MTSQLKWVKYKGIMLNNQIYLVFSLVYVFIFNNIIVVFWFRFRLQFLNQDTYSVLDIIGLNRLSFLKAPLVTFSNFISDNVSPTSSNKLIRAGNKNS